MKKRNNHRAPPRGLAARLEQFTVDLLLSSGCGVGWLRQGTSMYRFDASAVLFLAGLVLADEAI
jgi:hypothetical protein